MSDRRDLYDEWCQLSRKVEGMKFIFQNELDTLNQEDIEDFRLEVQRIKENLDLIENRSLEVLNEREE